MPNPKKVLTAAVLIGLCVTAVFVGRNFLFPRALLSKNALDLVRSRGNPSAPIWIVEYSDYQCPSCRGAFYILEDAVKTFQSKLYLQARFFPLGKHPYGLKSAVYAAAAAEQNKFWPFHAILFEKQPEWSEAPVEKIDALFESYAREAGLDVKKLAAAVENPKTKEKVLEETEKAKSLGVSITPTFFINGKMAAGLTAFKEEMVKLLDI